MPQQSPFTSFVAPSSRCNQTLADANEMVANLATQGYSAVIFAEQIGSGAVGSYMVPEKKGQSNGSAPWVDTSQDLTTLGVPTDLAIYIQIWVEAKKDYYIGAGVAKSLSRGETADQALE
jgi:hypothetical protein